MQIAYPRDFFSAGTHIAHITYYTVAYFYRYIFNISQSNIQVENFFLLFILIFLSIIYFDTLYSQFAFSKLLNIY